MKLSNSFKVIKNNKQLKAGCIMLILLLGTALLAPVISPYNPYALSDDMVVGPSSKYLLGTDGLGRDILSMILYGARTSLTVGFTAAMIAGIIGTLLGGFAGYFGGAIDGVIGEMINIFMMMPTFFLILIVVALFGSGLFNVMVVIGLTTWVGNAKLMRAQAMSLRERTFIKSSESIGESKLTILFKHIIPNGIFPIIANTTMGVSGAILAESSLAFLGLGDPNVISWGQIIQNGKSYLVDGWWICVFSGLVIIFTVITFYLIGDGLNRVLSPKIRNLGKEGRG
ncbi:MAG: oligopeptide/dipeptide transporter permease [Clostridiales bacterium]|jgi:peptide/nickel transport system permease protein|nr:oligopeptide/dipeptide transporter permease [Clostridiales bacterium]